MSGITRLTNATKANVIALVNAIIGILVAFGVGLSDSQQAAIITGINAVFALWIGLTYRDSPKRIPEE